MVILVDNGHGYNTAGKRSPDGEHREYLWARNFATILCIDLIARGYDARRIVTEGWDVSIKERVRRVNEICRKVGTKNVILLSMHNDASGKDGKWHSARGFSSRVSLNASANSKRLATIITQTMKEVGVKVNHPLPDQLYWKQNLGICRDTNCPAVLCENLFQDNRKDVKLLHDEKFLAKLSEAYVDAIDCYLGLQ